MLADIIKHMTPDRAFEDAYPQVPHIPPTHKPHFITSLISCFRGFPAAVNQTTKSDDYNDESVVLQLQSVMTKILTYFHNFSILFSMVSAPSSVLPHCHVPKQL